MDEQEKLGKVISLVSGLLDIVRGQQEKIERLETALEVVQDSPALTLKELHSEVASALHDFDEDSEPSNTLLLLDEGKKTIRNLE